MTCTRCESSWSASWIAGLLVLLYAQNLADIENTTTTADDDGTTLRLTLATVPIVLPDPLARLMREHLAIRRGHATIGQPGDVPWLFPGGRPKKWSSAWAPQHWSLQVPQRELAHERRGRHHPS